MQAESPKQKVRRTFLEVILDEPTQEAGAGAASAGGAGDGDAKMTDAADVPVDEAANAAKLAALEAALAALGDTEAPGEKGLRKSLQAKIEKLKPQTQSSTKKSSAVQLESKSAWVEREEKRLQQLEEDITKAQAALKTKKENLEKEKSELAKLRAAFSPPQNQAAAAAQIAELEKQELESLRLLASSSIFPAIRTRTSS